MPIYEFECRQCRRKFGALVLSRERLSEVRCKGCGGSQLERLWSRFSSPKSEDARLESMADPAALSGLDENDPKSMARLMKKMGKEMGEDIPDDFEQAMEEGLDGAEGGEASDGSDDL